MALTIRRAFELLSRRRRLTLRFPVEFTRRRICVSPDSALKLVRSSSAFDPMLLELARQEVRAGMTVWDVGANVGVFAVAAADRAKGGCVVAIEPDPFLGSHLRRTIGFTENSDLGLVLLPAAISSRAGATFLQIAARGRAANAIREAGGSTQMGGVREEICVPALALDDLIAAFGSRNVIKVDTEGAERLLLAGAEEVLGTVRPVWLIEVSSENCREVTEVFNKYNYRLFDAECGPWRSTEVIRCATNTLAVPEEKYCSPSAEFKNV